MPRSLARLRYRSIVPKPPLSKKRTLAERVAVHVDRKSKPSSRRIQVVVNPKAVRPAAGQRKPLVLKPFTLRDLVDPKQKTAHGEIIYVFRNVKTSQVIYSLQELLADHHREQLPFIGKHSKPPVLRPDEWTPHCVITFPTPEQGQNAFRQLREFRKLHELSWDKTNPEWKKLAIKQRIKNIMDQKANMSADLAEVLRRQEKHGEDMTKELEEQEKNAKEFMDKRWKEIMELSGAAAAKEKEADRIKWLEHQIRSLNMKLAMKHNQNPADQKRLTSAKIIQEIRLKKLQYAVRKAEQMKKAQAELAEQAALANEPGAQEKLETMQQKRKGLQERLQKPGLDTSVKFRATTREMLKELDIQIATLELAFKAKSDLDNTEHYIARSVLPSKLKKQLRTPYTLEGVRVQWVDLTDALAAKGQWPETIEHETLPINQARSEIVLLSADQYYMEKSIESSKILEALEKVRSEATTRNKKRREVNAYLEA